MLALFFFHFLGAREHEILRLNLLPEVIFFPLAEIFLALLDLPFEYLLSEARLVFISQLVSYLRYGKLSVELCITCALNSLVNKLLQL
jgi:hypothetical protein